MEDLKGAPVQNSLSSDPSVTRWLMQLQRGDESTARWLWEFVHLRLRRLAGRELTSTAALGFDEEDVALSAFDAFCRTVKEGRYHAIDDRDDMWRLLTVITLNKVRRRTRDENRIRRGGGLTRVANSEQLLQELASAQPEPATICMVQDEFRYLIERLERHELKLTLFLKVEGYTSDEVATRLGCTRRTVDRRLALIREIWSEEIA